MIKLTLTLRMTTVQVIETSVRVNNNSPIQDYVHPDDRTQPTYEKTPGFKPFTVLVYLPTTLENEQAVRGTGQIFDRLKIRASDVLFTQEDWKHMNI